MATNPPDKRKHPYAWPVGINLAFLLFMVAFNRHNGPGLGLFTLALALFNGFLGLVFLLFERLLFRRQRGAGYAGGFFLSLLLLLIIGFGMCARESRNHQEVEVIEDPAQIH
ncbi:hypothetical protein [Hymenobacter properus]|uniref:Uncharacterized protein n=1 Tax=Hymenobacter properus TaxID=2791026 RepID=A0A931BPJ8_9BACT|nr:hypothetical protein [Hymenobacter properus]MBF9143260.1 hypothetical protein [Hymenobacter properus]MBR7722070.1 hypothetical protein [Microvirga sp. SRT04]